MPSDQALHEVRLRVKRLRYACEAVEPVIGRPARRLAKAAGSLQDVLGSLHDTVIAQAWLRRAAAAGSSEETLLADQLVSALRLDAERFREAWRERWQRLENKRLVKWLA